MRYLAYDQYFTLDFHVWFDAAKQRPRLIGEILVRDKEFPVV